MKELTTTAVLKQILREEGVEAFQDPYRFWALFEDMKGGHDTDGMLLLYLVNHNMLSELEKAYAAQNNASRQKIVSSLESTLLKSSGFSDEDVGGFLTCVSSAFDWKITLASRQDVKKPPIENGANNRNGSANAGGAADSPNGAGGRKKKSGTIWAIIAVIIVLLIARFASSQRRDSQSSSVPGEHYGIVSDLLEQQESEKIQRRTWEVERAYLAEYPNADDYLSDDHTGCVVDNVELWLRTGPGEEYDTILSLPSGTLVSIYAMRGSWSLVNFKETVGWCRTDDIAVYSGAGHYAWTLSELNNAIPLLTQEVVKTIEYLLSLDEPWEQCVGANYIGSYLLVERDEEAGGDFNRLGIIYELTINIDSDDYDIHRYVTYYFVQEYHDIAVFDDGGVLVDFNDYRNAEGDDFFIPEGLCHYQGYPSFSELQEKWVDPYYEDYDVRYTTGLLDNVIM